MIALYRSLVGVALALATPQIAAAQSFPAGPVKLLVGYAAGGSTDVIARDIAAELEAVWGQPVVVDNRGGANGAIAAAQLAKLPADGQTLMMIVSGHVTNNYLNPQQSFDAIKDFTPISVVASTPLLIVAHPSFPANDVPGMLALAKEKPGAITYSSAGVGSVQHLSMELLATLSGAKFTHIPYRSAALAMNDTLAGHVPLSFLTLLAALPHLQANTIKAIAVSSASRVESLPNAPTIAERGLPGYEAELWYAVIAPAGLSPALTAKINADLVRIVGSEKMQKKLGVQGARPVGNTPAEAAAFMTAESKKWGTVIKDANIKPE